MNRLLSHLLTLACIALHGIAHAEPPAMPTIAYEDIPKVEVEDLIQYMTPLEGTTPAQWRVLWMTDAAREATVSWTTKEEGSKHRVLYGTDPDHLDLIQETQTTICNNRDAKKHPAHSDFFHHTNLTGLQPDTNYYFVMESDGVRSKTLYFRTAPASGTGFSIIHGGDSRSGHTARCQMNLLIAASARDHKEILALAHGGDYIKQGSSTAEWRLWLSQHELTTASDGRVLPLIPAKGNHDRSGDQYDRVFNMIDSGHRSWFVTTLGDDVSMVTLDTNSSASDQADWLEKTLSALRPKNRWLVVQCHVAMFPAIKGPSKHAPVFVPLFEKYNVDLACESDGHCMKRTVPIRDGKKDPSGVVYVGEGGLGVQQKRSGGRWYLEDGGKHGSGHHFVLLDFTDESLRCRFIRMNSEVWDDHILKAR